MIKRISSITCLVLIFLLFFSFVNNYAFAAYDFTAESGLSDSGTEMGYDESGNLKQPPAEIIGMIINIALSLMGVIFLGLTIYGGFIWMLARGDQSQVEKALSIIKNSFIGLVIVLAAYALTSFIYSAFF